MTAAVPLQFHAQPLSPSRRFPMFAAEGVPPRGRGICFIEAISESAGSGISRGKEKGHISHNSHYRAFSAMRE